MMIYHKIVKKKKIIKKNEIKLFKVFNKYI